MFSYIGIKKIQWIKIGGIAVTKISYNKTIFWAALTTSYVYRRLDNS